MKCGGGREGGLSIWDTLVNLHFDNKQPMRFGISSSPFIRKRNPPILRPYSAKKKKKKNRRL